jgi:hypothetical protein
VVTPKLSMTIPIFGSSFSHTPSPSPHKLLSRGAASHPPHTPSQPPSTHSQSTPSQPLSTPSTSVLESPTDTFERQLGNSSLDFSILEEHNSHNPTHTKPRALNFDELDFTPSPPSSHIEAPPPVPPKPTNLSLSRTKDDILKPSSSSVPKPSNPVSSSSFHLPPISMSRGNSINSFPSPTPPLPSTPTHFVDPFNLFSSPQKTSTPKTSGFDMADPFSITPKNVEGGSNNSKVTPQKKPSSSDLLLGEDPFDDLC